MPENQTADFIDQAHYERYTNNWETLVKNHEADTLPQAFRATEAERINFLNFSIDQVTALTAPGITLIKARFLAIPDASNVMRFSTTLFGLNADGEHLTKYYIPILPPPASAPATQSAEPAAGSETHITRQLAVDWLTAWVDAKAIQPTQFDTPNGILHGYDFEVRTLKDPLAAAQPTDGKGLFLNLGLHQDLYSPALAKIADLVVYINLLGSRTQGTLAGLPDDESFYNGGTPCPPKPMMS